MNKPRMIDLVLQLKKKCSIEEESLGCRLGLTAQETFAMSVLEEGEKVSGSEFSRRLGLSVSRGSRTIEKLLRRGLLVRKQDEQDRRTIKVSLSTKGVNLRSRSEKEKNDCEQRILSKIEPGSVDQVRKSMEILLKAL